MVAAGAAVYSRITAAGYIRFRSRGRGKGSKGSEGSVDSKGSKGKVSPLHDDEFYSEHYVLPLPLSSERQRRMVSPPVKRKVLL